MTTTPERHRTRVRGDHNATDDGDHDAAERYAAGALLHRWCELGVEMTITEAHEVIARIQRQHCTEMYWTALNSAVAAKRARETRRQARRLWAQGRQHG